MGWAKLFSSITESSLWSEPKEVRLLFVTMLAKANSVGFVESSIPGLARVSNLTQEEIEIALPILEGPDPHSKNPECEGRRIIKAPGGYLVLNFEDYRNRTSEEERKEYMREYMQKYRASKQAVNNVKKCKENPSASSSVSSSGSEEGESEGKQPTAEDIYNAYPRKGDKQEALRAINKRLKDFGATNLLERTLSFAKTQPANDQFTPLAATWFNKGRFNDDPVTWAPEVHDRKQKKPQPWEILPKAKPTFTDLYQ